MRIQIALPPDVGDQIRSIAESEHRPIKYQIEALVIEAVKARCSESARGRVQLPSIRHSGRLCSLP